MALLVFSDKCKFSIEIIEFIKSQPVLTDIIRFHNISTGGVPSKQITRVPTLVTNEGKMCVGKEVKAWLDSMIPVEFESWDSGGMCANLDGTEESCSLFDMNRYGESLQPNLTPDLEEKINLGVMDAYQKMRKT